MTFYSKLPWLLWVICVCGAACTDEYLYAEDTADDAKKLGDDGNGIDNIDIEDNVEAHRAPEIPLGNHLDPDDSKGNDRYILWIEGQDARDLGMDAQKTYCLYSDGSIGIFEYRAYRRWVWLVEDRIRLPKPLKNANKLDVDGSQEFWVIGSDDRLYKSGLLGSMKLFLDDILLDVGCGKQSGPDFADRMIFAINQAGDTVYHIKGREIFDAYEFPTSWYGQLLSIDVDGSGNSDNLKGIWVTTNNGYVLKSTGHSSGTLTWEEITPYMPMQSIGVPPYDVDNFLSIGLEYGLIWQRDSSWNLYAPFFDSYFSRAVSTDQRTHMPFIIDRYGDVWYRWY